MDLGLTGQPALVAAASKGMGRAVAEGLAREGARVALFARTPEGARAVLASCSHAVLSGHAFERIDRSPISKLIVTDSMPLAPEKRKSGKIVVLTIAELLARAIKNIHDETSVTSLFV